MPKRQHRTLDFALYIAISLALLAVVVFCAENKIGIGWSRRLAVILFTALVFGSWIQGRRVYWKKWRFWLLGTALLVVHIAAWTTILFCRPTFQPVSLLMASGVPELIVFLWLADQLLPRTPSHHHQENAHL
jgi:hypothetical protein